MSQFFYKIKMKMYQPNRVIQLSVMYHRRKLNPSFSNVSWEDIWIQSVRVYHKEVIWTQSKKVYQMNLVIRMSVMYHRRKLNSSFSNVSQKEIKLISKLMNQKKSCKPKHLKCIKVGYVNPFYSNASRGDMEPRNIQCIKITLLE